jgi:hypothetical protein
MSSSTERVASLRRQRKQNGYKESTIWLSPEDEMAITGIIDREGFKSRSEVVSYALRIVSNQEQKMQG